MIQKNILGWGEGVESPSPMDQASSTVLDFTIPIGGTDICSMAFQSGNKNGGRGLSPGTDLELGQLC